MPTYHPDLPSGCPPAEAIPMTGVIYRKARKPPHVITNADFYSGRERGDKTEDADCQRWGTSVWVHFDDVTHDLENFPYLQKHRIVSVDIDPTYGVIQHTPTNNRPHHRTFWRDYEIDFSQICRIVYSPDAWELQDAV